MAKITKQVVEKGLRDMVFDDLFERMLDTPLGYEYTKINDRQYGVILYDANGEQRYVRIGAIVAEIREDMTAEELMQSEIADYQAKQEAKAETARKREKKIAEDKAKRKAKAEEKDDDHQFLPSEVTY